MAPNHEDSACRIATNVIEVSIRKPTVSHGCAASMPRPRVTAVKTSAAWIAPNSAGGNQPPSATRNG